MIVRQRNHSIVPCTTPCTTPYRYSIAVLLLLPVVVPVVLLFKSQSQCNILGGCVTAFSPSIVTISNNLGNNLDVHQQQQHRSSNMVLWAVKKKMNAAAAAALAAIDQVEGKQQQHQQQQQQPSWMDDDDDDNDASKLSKKDLKKALASKKGKAVNVDDVVATIKTTAATAGPSPPEIEVNQKAVQSKQQQQQHDDSNGKHENHNPPVTPSSKSKRELMLEKALELEQADSTSMGDDDTDSSGPYKQERAPKLSAKELKALKKKEEKMAAKLEKKAAKKNGVKAGEDDDDEDEDERDEDNVGTVDLVNGSTSDDTDVVTITDTELVDEEAAAAEDTITLEDKIRKERPPPRIRVMENSAQGFTSLRLENVGITFRNQQVLNDVTWGVQTGDRIGLVGANGAGKTTQIRILAGELEPTTGDVVKSSKDVRTAVLRQEFIDELVLDRTLREEFTSVFEIENQILNDIKSTEYALENTPSDDVDAMQSILDRMQELQNLAEDKAVYTLDSRIKKIMDLMGFTDDEGDDLVASFSGGWKMRIGLGKALLREPSVLLLDEPTNHMDLNSVEWLEAFLRQQNIPMVIVSHDREFLDQVCNKIVDAEMGICTEYNGNYSRFLQLKKTRMESWQAAYNAQEKKIQEERRWIQKFKITQSQTAKQREAKLEKLIKSDEYVKRPPFVGKPFKFRFPDAPRLSPEVAEIKDLSHSYSNDQTRNRLFDNADLFISKGDRIAIVGPNGSGKSTLLRLLIGREEPDDGVARIVGQNVVVSYFEQNQADALDLHKTVLETIQGASRGQSYNELRALLGQFLFKGDAVDKKVESLSGGEKARLSLCCMMLSEHNVLILDEPTNHLDIQSKEMMEEALMNYAGSVIVVSHDRYFISRVATTIVAIEDKKLVRYQGDYKSYMERSDDFKEKIESRFINGVTRIEAAPVIDLDELEGPIKKKNFGGASTAGLVTRKNKGIKNAKRAEAR